MELCLPEGKLRELQALIQSWVGRRSCVWKELESLVVMRARWCSQGRLLFWALERYPPCPPHVRLNAAFWADLAWWARFLEDWNGLSVLQAGAPGECYDGCVGQIWLWSLIADRVVTVSMACRLWQILPGSQGGKHHSERAAADSVGRYTMGPMLEEHLGSNNQGAVEIVMQATVRYLKSCT